MNGRSYLIDENTTPALADQLRRRRSIINVMKIGDESAPPKGTPDKDILLWIERHGFSLVTRNRKSMPYHLDQHLKSEHHVQGIFVLRPRASLGEVIDDLIHIWESSEPDEFQDQIVRLPL